MKVNTLQVSLRTMLNDNQREVVVRPRALPFFVNYKANYDCQIPILRDALYRFNSQEVQDRTLRLRSATDGELARRRRATTSGWATHGNHVNWWFLARSRASTAVHAFNKATSALSLDPIVVGQIFASNLTDGGRRLSQPATAVAYCYAMRISIVVGWQTPAGSIVHCIFNERFKAKVSIQSP
jgi:hypothetical protein